MKATRTNVIQVQEDMPNRIYQMNGYEPTTNYWALIIRLSNALLLSSALDGATKEDIVKGANFLIEHEIFKSPEQHSAVEWAELTMSINHVLWFWHEVGEEKGIEYIEPVTRALSDVYYQWQDKALKTLKGDDLSTYLRITD